jgi:hypothetical protein
VDAGDFERVGLYNAAAPHAAQQLELLEYLVALGATLEDLVEYGDQLPALASVVALRGGPAMTLAEAATRSGLPEDQICQFTRAAGFPTPGPQDRVFTDGFVTLATAITAADALQAPPHAVAG